MFADWLRYEQPTDEVTPRGNVRIELGADVLDGDRLQFNLGTERGYMDNAALHAEQGLRPQPGHRAA